MCDLGKVGVGGGSRELDFLIVRYRREGFVSEEHLIVVVIVVFVVVVVVSSELVPGL